MFMRKLIHLCEQLLVLDCALELGNTVCSGKHRNRIQDAFVVVVFDSLFVCLFETQVTVLRG